MAVQHLETRDADRAQIYLDYMLFMNHLIKEAIIKGKQAGERGLTAKAIHLAQVVSVDAPVKRDGGESMLTCF